MKSTREAPADMNFTDWTWHQSMWISQADWWPKKRNIERWRLDPVWSAPRRPYTTHVFSIKLIRHRDSLTWVSQRMMMGRKNPKKPETAGGRTPEMKANEAGDARAHCSRKGTYTRSCRSMRRLEHIERGESLSYRIEIGQNRDYEERNGVKETHQCQPHETQQSLPHNFTIRLIHVLPDLHRHMLLGVS